MRETSIAVNGPCVTSWIMGVYFQPRYERGKDTRLQEIRSYLVFVALTQLTRHTLAMLVGHE